MSEPTIEEQLAIVTNSRNALQLSTDQLYKDNQKTLADHAKALADQATKNQEAIAKLEQDHATALATKATELATANATIATKDATITANNSEIAAKSTIIEAVTTEKQALAEQLETVTSTIATLQAEVAKLTAIRQYNPRWTTPDYFINRFTAHEAKAFYSSNDPIIVRGRELLEEYETATPPYHVDLDDERVQGLTGYMVQLGMITMERRVQVLSDVTAQEAFYPA